MGSVFWHTSIAMVYSNHTLEIKDAMHTESVSLVLYGPNTEWRRKAMHPEDFIQRLGEIIDDLLRKGLERPFYFACIAADGCTMTGSYGIDDRVVVTHPAQEELPLPINLLFVDKTKAQHVALSEAHGPG
jgi:hypothetical protein